MKARLGDLLLHKGLITEEQLEKALETQKGLKERVLLGQVLLKLGYVTHKDIADILLSQGVKKVTVDVETIDRTLISKFSEKFLRDNMFIPYIQVGSVVSLAMSDPTNFILVDEVRERLGVKRVIPNLIDPEELEKILNEVFSFITVDGTEDFDLKKLIQDTDDDDDDELDQEDMDALLEDDSPIMALVNNVVIKAINMGVTDIHVEPQIEDDTRIRFRIDGALVEYSKIPTKMHNQFISRLKVMANMDTANRLEPLDGEIRFKYNNRIYHMRVSTLPLVSKEKMVIRILGQNSELTSIDNLDMSPKNLAALKRASKRKQEMILVTGPTGSGKSTTLYAVLADLNDEQTNIVTIENPVEIKVKGISQVQTNSRLTFASALRTILRQDPDVIMVGEIRDSETAQIAVRAALTGHLMLSTLHTNDAVSTITRLGDMGLETYLLASSLALVVSQRLVRRVCDKCRIPDEEGLAKAKSMYPDIFSSVDVIYKGAGCSHCNNTGMRGRIAVHEVLEVTDELRDVIALGDPAKLRDMVEPNLILKDGFEKVIAGHTNYEEVLSKLL